jgi:peptidoglycan/xylan/chitin deacetylase (PgdA/CDA1 family)
MPAHVSGPAYSTGPYYAPYQSHPYPYEHGNVNHHYQQSTYERYTFDVLMNLSTSFMLILLHCSYFLQWPLLATVISEKHIIQLLWIVLRIFNEQLLA